MRDSSVQLLVEELQRTFPIAPTQGEPFGWLAPPLDVLDCVLSLNRSYDSFCLPRVLRFQKRHPDVSSLADLLRLIESYPTPLDFSVNELDYRDQQRSIILVSVLRYLNGIEAQFPEASESARLEAWANSVRPSDYVALDIRGFALSDFQYLRMLLGAQTVKPDVHIRRFVSGVVGRNVGDAEALALLERAGGELGWPLTDLDYAIWERLARSESPASVPFITAAARGSSSVSRYRQPQQLNGPNRTWKAVGWGVVIVVFFGMVFYAAAVGAGMYELEKNGNAPWPNDVKQLYAE